MQILTFTQKLLRQRSFFSSLVPLLALFVGLGSAQTVSAQGINNNNVTILSRATASSAATTQTFDGTPPDIPVNQPFEGAVLGTNLAQAGGALTLTAALNDVNTTASRPIISSRLEYRVYPTGATVLPSYSTLNLPRTSASATGPNVILEQPSAAIDLLNQPTVLGGGDYTVEIRFLAVRQNGLGTATFGDGPFSATFSVIAPLVTPPGGTTTWISTSSTDWTVASNWSNGVPTRFADAIIPEKNSTNTNTVTPTLLNTNPTLYEVKSITLNGTSNATRALLRIGQTVGSVISGATLNVYGDLNTFSGGILASQTGINGVANPALNSTIALKGGNQAIRGLLAVADIRIEGTGVKNVVNTIAASNTFSFVPGVSALVRTVTESIDPSNGTRTFTYNSTKTSIVTLKTSGILLGETNTAYIDGVTLSDRTLVAGQMQTFGNVGVDITSNRDILGSPIEITRTVGDPLAGITASNQPTAGGVIGAKPIKRQYGVSGDVNNAPTVSTVVFHYLDNADELNGNPEPNLVIFRTSNNGIPYNAIGGIVDVAANTVTQINVRAINTITLGDSQKPLPVNLTAFDAKRVGTDALVTWETASEQNSRGYDVQVSTTGKEFRTLTSVPSAAPNSNRTTQYRYIDTEANKTGTRYYRLRQVDLDGKEAFYSAVAVSFTGKASESALVAYPNPLSGTEQLHLTYQSATAGQGQLRITDMTGRLVRQQSLDVTAGTTDLAVEQLSSLKNGMYLVRLTLPSGQVQNLKVVKQ